MGRCSAEHDTRAKRFAPGQPVFGAAPPSVWLRTMKATLENNPVPACALARSTSHGMAPAAGAALSASFSPVTLLPSLARQTGPAP
jgi:hypothetical protein